MRIFWILVYFCLVGSFINVNAAETTFCHTTDNNCDDLQCISVTFDQIHLTKDGMFIYIDRAFIPIEALYSDGFGQYSCDFHNTLPDHKTCRFCGLVYNRTHHRKCPNRNCTSNQPGSPIH